MAAPRSSSPSRHNFASPGGHRGSASAVSMRNKHHWDDKDLQEYVPPPSYTYIARMSEHDMCFSMIDDQAMSKQMADLPLDEDDIKRLPKKVLLLPFAQV
jgi:hypothetical protein